VPYVFVQDVAASWEQYTAFARMLAEPPTGLILHAAGPTDEGFRIVDVWESEEAWDRFRAERLSSAPTDDLLPPPLFRELRAAHVVYGSRAFARPAHTPAKEVGNA
jgi:hypothetical protein